MASEVRDAGRVHVVVVPVGAIAPAKFARYTALLARAASEVAFADLTASFNDASTSSFFYRQPFKQGAVQLAFVGEQWAAYSEYDRTSLHRHVAAVVGIIDCTVTHDMSEAFRQYTDAADKFEEVWEHRCFAFEQTESTQPDSGNSVILIPNQEDDRLVFYLSSMIADLASGVLLSIAKQVALLEDTAVDFEQRLAMDAPLRLKRKAPPRMYKFVADACLLGGSVREAMALYNCAIDLGKAFNNLDWLCVGGAIEGVVCAAIMLEPQPAALNSDHVDKYREAIACYEKAGAAELAVEACFKMVIYLHEHRKALLANEFMTRANDLKPELSVRGQLNLLMTSIQLYGQLGFARKAAFFIREASRVLASVDAVGALKILYNLLTAYDITPAAKEGKSGAVTVEWPRIQITVLHELTRLSEQIEDVPQCIFYTAFLLRKFTGFLNVSEQQSLVTRLAQLSMSLRGAPLQPSSLDDLPIVTAIELVHPPATLRPVPQAKPGDAAGKDPTDPFIYNPFQRAASTPMLEAAAGQPTADILLVQNEPFQVKLTLVNPLAVDLAVQGLRISGTGVDLDCPGLSLVVPARGRLTDVLLSARARKPGLVELRGVQMNVFHMQREFLTVVRTSAASAKQTGGRHKKVLSASSAASAGADASAIPFVRLAVIEELPRIQILESDMLAKPLALWEGEVCGMRFTIENVGTQPVTLLELTMEETYSRAPSVEDELFHHKYPLIRLEQQRLDGQLPLPPQAQVALHVTLYGKANCQGAVLKLNYGCLTADGERPAFARHMDVPLNVSCTPKLRVSALSIVPFERRDDLQAYIAMRGNAVAEPQGDPGDWAVLALEVANVSDEHPVAFTVDPDQPSMLLPPGGVAGRADLLLQRVVAAADEFEADLPVHGDRQFVVSGLAPEQERLRRQLYWTRRALASRLRMSWAIPSIGKTGVLPAELLPVAAKHVDALRTSTVVVTAACDRSVVERDGVVRVRAQVNNRHASKTFAGTLALHLSIAGVDVPPAEAHAYFYTEGPLLTAITATIAAGGQHTLDLPLFFVSTGVFDFALECTARSVEPPPTGRSPNLPLTVAHAARWTVSVR